ncbi:helix-turn-helix transcriptional regulator [Erysipelothrix rhusiopathiae]|uniref:helix-turn-helix transcriptional regulator n=1 Tax=Erysipelothrix rhusiopathiae TaxID=1648 RepID=UPI00338E1090
MRYPDLLYNYCLINTLICPPKQYINEQKLERAKHLILEGKYPITDVALKLGFSSIHYFSRKFKQHFGFAPSEYAQKIYTQEKGPR